MTELNRHKLTEQSLVSQKQVAPKVLKRETPDALREHYFEPEGDVTHRS